MISEKDIIYVTKRQASIGIAVVSALCLFVFVLGYFWGKQSVIDDFSQRVTQESVNDQMDYLLTMQSFAEVEKSKQDTTTEKKLNTNNEQVSADKKVESIGVPQDEKKKDSLEKEPVLPEQKHQYYATLIGFGTRNAAANFVNRLKKHNIHVDIRPRKSKSSSGKITKTWYQVLTKSYKSKPELQKVIDRVKKLEKIKSSDIKIK